MRTGDKDRPETLLAVMDVAAAYRVILPPSVLRQEEGPSQTPFPAPAHSSPYSGVLLPVRTYLFGSFAAGTYTNKSDLDLYIVIGGDVSDLAAETKWNSLDIRVKNIGENLSLFSYLSLGKIRSFLQSKCRKDRIFPGFLPSPLFSIIGSIIES